MVLRIWRWRLESRESRQIKAIRTDQDDGVRPVSLGITRLFSLSARSSPLLLLLLASITSLIDLCRPRSFRSTITLLRCSRIYRLLHPRAYPPPARCAGRRPMIYHLQDKTRQDTENMAIQLAGKGGVDKTRGPSMGLSPFYRITRRLFSAQLPLHFRMDHRCSSRLPSDPWGIQSSLPIYQASQRGLCCADTCAHRPAMGTSQGLVGRRKGAHNTKGRRSLLSDN